MHNQDKVTFSQQDSLYSIFDLFDPFDLNLLQNKTCENTTTKKHSEPRDIDMDSLDFQQNDWASTDEDQEFTDSDYYSLSEMIKDGRQIKTPDDMFSIHTQRYYSDITDILFPKQQQDSDSQEGDLFLESLIKFNSDYSTTNDQALYEPHLDPEYEHDSYLDSYLQHLKAQVSHKGALELSDTYPYMYDDCLADTLPYQEDFDGVSPLDYEHYFDDLPDTLPYCEDNDIKSSSTGFQNTNQPEMLSFISYDSKNSSNVPDNDEYKSLSYKYHSRYPDVSSPLLSSIHDKEDRTQSFSYPMAISSPHHTDEFDYFDPLTEEDIITIDKIISGKSS